jgi:hypothetical protein
VLSLKASEASVVSMKASERAKKDESTQEMGRLAGFLFKKKRFDEENKKTPFLAFI